MLVTPYTSKSLGNKEIGPESERCRDWEREWGMIQRLFVLVLIQLPPIRPPKRPFLPHVTMHEDTIHSPTWSTFLIPSILPSLLPSVLHSFLTFSFLSFFLPFLIPFFLPNSFVPSFHP